MSTDHDLLEKISTDESNIESLQLLQHEIAKLAQVDPDKVQAVINKIKNGTLDILGTPEEQMASAERIAKQIMDESNS